MVKPKDVELLGDIVVVSTRAERLFLRAQFEATSQAEIDWAQNGLRHARGLKKIAAELPQKAAATA